MVSSSPTTLIEHGAARIQLSPNTSEWCWVVKPSVNFSHLFPFESHVVLRTGVELAALLPGTGCRGRWSDRKGLTPRMSVLLRDTGCRAPWPGRKGARLRMPALLRDTGCRAHCRTERGSPSEGGTIARGEAPRTHATSPALELPILRRRVLGFSSWFRKGPYARVAEWQTRWLQVPVPFLGVEVQLLSRAHAGTPVRQGETPSQAGVRWF